MEPEAEGLVVDGCVTIGSQRICGENLRIETPSAETRLADAAGAGGPANAAAPASEGGLVASLTRWLDPILADPWGWTQANILRPDLLVALGIQFGAILGAWLASVLLAPSLGRLLRLCLDRLPASLSARVDETAPTLVRPALTAAALWLAHTVLVGMGQPHAIVRIAASLATAWLIIKAATAVLPEGLRRPVTWLALAIAVLSAFGVLDDVVAWSYTIGPPFGGRRINPPFIVQAILTAAIFLFAASWLSRKLKTRVETLPRVEPSIRILLANALQIGLFFAAAILTLAGLDIPLSGLAVLGGAIGVGLGFGMQQIVANFISGVILLTDRSIKPDDVIEVDETYGIVKSLGLRYASVITRDGKEHLIPNEMLITDKVVNWSYSDKKVRIKRRLRVEYESDLKLATDLVTEGAKRVARVLAEPAPKCLVMEFGDEAIEIEARFWIDDPENGVNNVASEVMLSVWDLFREHGIDIPLRHEDVLIAPGSTLKVEMMRERRKEPAKPAHSDEPSGE